MEDHTEVAVGSTAVLAGNTLEEEDTVAGAPGLGSAEACTAAVRALWAARSQGSRGPGIA